MTQDSSYVLAAFKLASGDEIITKARAVSSDTLELEKPRAIVLMRDGKGGVAKTIIPFMHMCPDASMFLNNSQIMTTVKKEDIPSDVIDAYLEDTSGIQLAKTLFS